MTTEFQDIMQCFIWMDSVVQLFAQWSGSAASRARNVWY